MTPCERLGYYVGNTLYIIEKDHRVPFGTPVTLINDDGTSTPFFSWVKDKNTCIGLQRVSKINPLQTNYNDVIVSSKKSNFVFPTIPMITPLLKV